MNKERGEACNHFEDKVAEGPPVCESPQVEPSFLEDFRGQILWGAGNRICILKLVIVAAESKINEFGIPLGVDEDVFGFEAE